MENKKKNWDIVIRPKNNFFQINFLEIYKYRDLIKMFVIRDFVTFYKQTILGPLWYVIQPLINSIVFTIIFGNLAKISTDGVPPFLFYLARNLNFGKYKKSESLIIRPRVFGAVNIKEILAHTNCYIGWLRVTGPVRPVSEISNAAAIDRFTTITTLIMAIWKACGVCQY